MRSFSSILAAVIACGALAIATRASAADDALSRSAQDANDRRHAVDAIQESYGTALAAARPRVFVHLDGGVLSYSPTTSATYGIAPVIGAGIGLRAPYGGFTLTGRITGVMALDTQANGTSESTSLAGATITGDTKFIGVFADGTIRFAMTAASPFFLGVGPRIGVGSANYTYYFSNGTGSSGGSIVPSSKLGLFVEAQAEAGVLLLESRSLELAIRADAGYGIKTTAYGIQIAPAWAF